jgi:hypothetical protein
MEIITKRIVNAFKNMPNLSLGSEIGGSFEKRRSASSPKYQARAQASVRHQSTRDNVGREDTRNSRNAGRLSAGTRYI